MIKAKGWTVVNGIKRKCLKPQDCIAVEVPGKYRYLFPLTKEMAAKIKPLAQPYPKREKQANVGTTDTAAEHHRPSRSNSLDNKANLETKEVG